MAKPVKKNRWTNVDAFALLNGISTWDKNYLNLKYVRIPGESNIELRQKIYNSHSNPAEDTSLQSLIRGLSNELNLTTYDIESKTTFDLIRTPFPSGDVGIQDIWLFYKPPGSGEWYEIAPQLWGSGYYTDYEASETQSSGFIVWEESYYKDSLGVTTKTSTYSTLLSVLPNPNLEVPLVDKSLIKIIYNVRLYDKDNNSSTYLYTDMPNEYDVDDDRLIYRIPYVVQSGDYYNSVIAYHLDEVQSFASGLYYTSGGLPTGMLYKLRDIIDNNFQHKWKNVRDKQSIWDVHKDYSKGTIQSFYDIPTVVSPENSGEALDVEDLFTGGIEYQDPVLNISDIYISEEDSVERWYPIMYPGKFYIGGQQYYLMENPQFSTIELLDSYSDIYGTCGSGVLPSGIERWYKIITHFNSNPSGESFVFEDYNYKIPYRQYDPNDASGLYNFNTLIYRKRPYITAAMGYQLDLGSGEYNIDFDQSPPVIHVSGVHNTELNIVWDEVTVPSGRICSNDYADLNPLNGDNVDFSKYFFVIGDE